MVNALWPQTPQHHKKSPPASISYRHTLMYANCHDTLSPLYPVARVFYITFYVLPYHNFGYDALDPAPEARS